MSASARKPRFVATVVAGFFLAITPVVAAERYALLVGISYEDSTQANSPTGPDGSTMSAPAKRNWASLPGTGNDVERMHATLLAVYGLSSKNVMLLRNAQATRAAILEALSSVLKKAKGGDHVLFYFAGHGSWVKNSLSRERDQRDETIVPADMHAGIRDIRDKDLRRLFNDAIDRGVLVTSIVDSCHSGSIARGASPKFVLRAASPDLNDIATELRDEKPDPRPDPDARQGGAVVLSASFEEVAARDGCELDGKVHGCFSAALFRAVRDAPHRPIEQIFASTQAILLGEANLQSPQIQGPLDRRRAPLFEQVGGPGGATLVPVERLAGDGRVVIGGGTINSVFPGAELVAADPVAKETMAIRLKVDSSGLSSASAHIVSGRVQDLRAGMMLRMDRWAMPERRSLAVWVAATKLSRPQLLQQVAKLRVELGDGVTWTEDPTENHPTHEIFWDGSAWRVIGPSRLDHAIGADLAAVRLREILGPATNPRPRLFLNVPPTGADVAAIDAAAKPIELAYRRESAPLTAQYVLAGRPRGSSGLEYAWLRRSAMDGDLLANPYPAVTDWETLGDNAEGRSAGAEKLAHLLRRLVVVNAWLSSDSPPADDRFPYRLEIREKAKSTSLGSCDVLRGGRDYQVVLRTDIPPKLPVERRFVYVFTLDRNGNGTLLYPRPTIGTSENLFPYVSAGNEPALEYPLRDFEVTVPFGVDSYFLLVTSTSLPDPSILNFDGVRVRAPTRGPSSPLETAFEMLGSGRRGVAVVTPADWRLERRYYQSVPR